MSDYGFWNVSVTCRAHGLVGEARLVCDSRKERTASLWREMGEEHQERCGAGTTVTWFHMKTGQIDKEVFGEPDDHEARKAENQALKIENKALKATVAALEVQLATSHTSLIREMFKNKASGPSSPPPTGTGYDPDDD